MLRQEVKMHGTYVYAHYVDGQPIYVGSGSWERANKSAYRPDRWQKLVANGYRIEIMGWFADRAEARLEEIRLIKELSPSCNLIHNGYTPPHSIGNQWNLGRKHTARAKAVMSAKQKASWMLTKKGVGHRRPRVPIKCVDTGEVYASLREAALATGAHYTSVSQCLNGHRGSAGGLRFARARGD